MDYSRKAKSLQVFRVEPDFRYSSVHFDASGEDGFNARYRRKFVGEAMRDAWKTVDCWLANPLLARADFFPFFPGALGLWPSTESRLGAIFSRYGELLPIHVEDIGKCAVVNITTVSSEAFDANKGVRRILGDKYLMEPTKYAFRPDVVGQLSLFRIPEEISAIFCVAGGAIDHTLNFYEQYTADHLTGLSLERVWEEGPFD